MNLYHIAVITTLIAFASASGLFLHSFAKNSTQEKIHRLAYGLFVIASGLMIHNTIAAYYYNLLHLTSSFVLITAIAWITILAQIFYNLRILSTLVAPLATLIMLLQFFFIAPHGSATYETGPTGLMVAHILVSVLGEAFAIIAFVIAVLYLLQQRALKKKQLNRLQGTQVSISKLNQALLISIWIGFILLSSGLIMGAIYYQFYFKGSHESLIGKVIWAFMIWLWYLLTLLSRNYLNISAKKLAWMTIMGFVLLSFGLFGINNWSYFFDW